MAIPGTQVENPRVETGDTATVHIAGDDPYRLGWRLASALAGLITHSNEPMLFEVSITMSEHGSQAEIRRVISWGA